MLPPPHDPILVLDGFRDACSARREPSLRNFRSCLLVLGLRTGDGVDDGVEPGTPPRPVLVLRARRGGVDATAVVACVRTSVPERRSARSFRAGGSGLGRGLSAVRDGFAYRGVRGLLACFECRCVGSGSLRSLPLSRGPLGAREGGEAPAQIP